MKTFRRLNRFRFQTERKLSKCTESLVLPSNLHPSMLEELSRNNPKMNIPQNIIDKLGKDLHKNVNHPLGIIKKKIELYVNNSSNQNFEIYDSFPPIVNVKCCFDDLRVPVNHVSRNVTDTYYVSDNKVLRTHTSAHQCHLIRQGVSAFLCSGDVYRRDEIDSSHYPVFHQMEGVRIFKKSDYPGISTEDMKKMAEEDLKKLLSGLALHLFGEIEMRWRNDYFPFTDPSFELEVKFNGDWLEVLGCGVIHDEVLENSGLSSTEGNVGWAFGLGLERLAMILFSIPDIRLFWSTDDRFTSQFTDGVVKKFIPYSKYPECYKDVSFWLPESEDNKNAFHPNDVYELIREFAGDLVEKVHLFDEFVHPKTLKSSQSYRITYRHMGRNLTNEEVDEIQLRVRGQLVSCLKVTLR